MRRFWCAEVGIFLGLWLALMLVGRSSLLRDPGTFWHTVVGQQMLDSGHVIEADSLSFTRAGQPWVAHQWLAECGMAAVYRRGGWDALLLFSAALLAATYAWVAQRLLRAGFHPLWTAGVMSLVLLASSHQFHVRPLILSILLFGLTFALLIDVEAGRRRLRHLWWFVPLALVWANLHGGVLAEIATVGLCAGGWCVAWMLGWDSPVRSGRDALAVVGLTVAACLVVLVNPYGAALPRAWLITLAIPLPELIKEHAPLDLADPLGWTTILLATGYFVALVGLLPKRPRITWLIPLVWFVLAAQRVRSVPLFAIATAVALAEVLPQTRWATWLFKREVLLPVREDQPRRCHVAAAIIPLVLVVALMSIPMAGVKFPGLEHGWAKFDPTIWPVDLLPELKQLNRTADDGTPIFNDMNYGGFLIYHAPRLRVFADDRCALYGKEFLEAYEDARRKHPAQIDRWRQQYGFRHALVETGTNFDRYLQDAAAWKPVRRTPTATLYRWDPR